MDYNARFYSPLLGRFIQPDSIVPDPGDSQSWNRYSYVVNNPVNRIDPSGHYEVESESCGPDEQLTGDGCAKSGDGINPGDPGYCKLHPRSYLCTGPTSDSPRGGYQTPGGGEGLGDPFIDYGIDVTYDQGLTHDQITQFHNELLRIINSASPEFLQTYLAGSQIEVKLKTSGKCGRHFNGTIYLLGSGCDSSTDNHEIWHFIDYKSGRKLSSGLMEYAGAKQVLFWYKVGDESAPDYAGKPPNRREDFAESAEEYYYPNYSGIQQNESRWEFIDHLLTTGEILTR